MPCLKDNELAFIYVPSRIKGKDFLSRIYKEDFIKMRVEGWSTAEIMEGVRKKRITAKAQNAANKDC